MIIVRGLARNLLEKAKETCLLAVDVYNKPKTSFRSGAFIVLMNIAWTSLFHAIFQYKRVNYYYMTSKRPIRYEKINGDKKSWELKECVKKYFSDKNKDYESIKKNIEFFIPLRNKIEHRFMPELDDRIFGECQSLLSNFELILSEEFGDSHSIHENLVYSLQFSRTSTKEAKQSSEFSKIKEYITGYEKDLPPNILSDPKYRFQAVLIQTNNLNKADLAIKFIPLGDLSDEELDNINYTVGITKERIMNVSNARNLRAIDVAKKVKLQINNHYNCKINFNTRHHNICAVEYKANKGNKAKNKRETNPDFCIYDEVFEDYSYTEKWEKYLMKKLKSKEEILRLFPSFKKEILHLMTVTEVIKKYNLHFKKEYGLKINMRNKKHMDQALNEGIRPSNKNLGQITTDERYCFHVGGTHYLYTPEWLNFLINKGENDIVEKLPNKILK
ncbi:hypothetical protein MARBORIA2_14740 [Methanobrevibacter arboriphilus]|uniref:DUF3644 domain-containing protein n=1 Tax=Methanobrevibacter arboriphilus TaxID=39441 RepID=UPI0022EF6E6D|nr:DUF3644 domain-containing protein [Methanobrevibacter arboriphilus]GLI12384.1 hypothetical protein MARBORIA2_14740 [Methanobrevibacter arboriphilus]